MPLPHLPFWELVAEQEDGSPLACTVIAGFMPLRLIDHTVLDGADMVQNETWGKPLAKDIRETVRRYE